MTSGRRSYLEKMIALWAPRAAARRASGAARDLTIAAVLERAVADYQAELAEAGSVAPPGPPPPSAGGNLRPGTGERGTWSSPTFWAGGRFNPFAGTHAEQMLASADVADRLGHPDVAAGYRRRAAEQAPGAPLERNEDRAPRRSSRRPIWTGPNITPPEPTPFVAGEQLGLFG